MEGEIEERAITFEDILVFVTGADHLPPLGFEDILTLRFDHSTAVHWLLPVRSHLVFLLASVNIRSLGKQ